MKLNRPASLLTLAAACLLTSPLFAQLTDAQSAPTGTATAQTPAPVPAAASFCQAEEHRQFDFWIGEWDVSSNGQPAGSNRVHAIHNGCALQENWQGASAGGISGTSYNLYDRARQQWHQTWVDSSGNLLQLDGGLVDGVMVLTGERPTADGRSTAIHRISWTPNDDGTVRQLWQASQDNGASWSVVFDGLYSRRGR